MLSSWRGDVHHITLFPLRGVQQAIRRGGFGLRRGAGYLAPNAGTPGTLQMLASAGADRSPGGEDILLPFARSRGMFVTIFGVCISIVSSICDALMSCATSKLPEHAAT